MCLMMGGDCGVMDYGKGKECIMDNGKERANIIKEKNMGIWEKIYCVIERIVNVMGRDAYSVPWEGIVAPGIMEREETHYRMGKGMGKESKMGRDGVVWIDRYIILYFGTRSPNPSAFVLFLS